MTTAGRKIVPVLLSGGAGTRLWPLSRADLPKQLHALVGDSSLLRQTAARVGDPAVFAPLVVVTAADTRFAVAEHLRQEGVQPGAILLEPTARDTAPAVAVAAQFVARTDPTAILLVLPSDHYVADAEAFRHSILAGRAAAEAGRLVAFGIPPTRAEVGFGYIARGEPVAGAPGVQSIARFVEKPDVATAERLVGEGYLWNAGMFLFRRFMAERSIAYVIGFLTLTGFLLSLPTLGMFYGLHHWTAAVTGGIVDARFIALVDTALESPLGQIAMIPMLAWIARSAPADLKATYFAIIDRKSTRLNSSHT